METLADSLGLVFEAVPEVLVPSASRGGIHELAAALPSIHCAGFEVRLAGEHRPVDFAQRIVGFSGEPTRLADHIEATAGPQTSPPWPSLGRFARDWARPATIVSDEVAGAWLEFDAGGTPRPLPAPSLFISLRVPAGRGDADRLLRLVGALSQRFAGKPPTEALIALIERCVDRCTGKVGITDVGMMLSRPTDGIRLAAAGFAPDDAAAFLSDLEWPGEREALAAAVSMVPTRSGLTLSFDLAGEHPAPLPRVGVEYFPGSYLDDIPQWEQFLTTLVERGMCDAPIRDALLAWPGYTTPDAEGGTWPAALIAESMLRPPDEFSVIGRRLSHVKITCGPAGLSEAKAYFGYGPLWLRPEAAPPDEIDHGGAGLRASSAATVAADTRESLLRAIDFLAGAQSAEGFWCDFADVTGGTDEWVTAYAGAALAAIGGYRAQQPARRAWRWLLGRRGDDQGWGFSASLPEDADGTAWGLLLSHALGEQDTPRARAARSRLEEHTAKDGAVASYLPAASARLAETLGPDVCMTGLFAPHLCVTAAAALLPGTSSSAGYLRDHQAADGRWVGYWWCDDEYATGLASLALGGNPESGARAAATRAAAWAAGRVGEDGAVVSLFSGEPSAFATASCAAAVLGATTATRASDLDPAAVRAIGWLRDVQCGDGSWAPSALMRIPPVDAISPPSDGFGSFVGLDAASIFTTATVVRALRLFEAFRA